MMGLRPDAVGESMSFDEILDYSVVAKGTREDVEKFAKRLVLPVLQQLEALLISGGNNFKASLGGYSKPARGVMEFRAGRPQICLDTHQSAIACRVPPLRHETMRAAVTIARSR